MGFLALNRLMFKQKEQRRRRRIHRYAADQKSTKVLKKKDSLCQEDDHSEGGKRSRYPGSNLPEDIWCHIHSLMPLRDAAHSACLSHAFFTFLEMPPQSKIHRGNTMLETKCMCWWCSKVFHHES